MTDYELRYHEVTSRYHPGLANVFVRELNPSGVRAVLMDGRTKQWTAASWNVSRLMAENEEQDEGRIRVVDRSTAETLARTLGSQLPDESEIRRLMAEERRLSTS